MKEEFRILKGTAEDNGVYLYCEIYFREANIAIVEKKEKGINLEIFEGITIFGADNVEKFVLKINEAISWLR